MDANILLKFNLENRHFVINNLLKTKNNSIYTGKSGIIIYLLELYSITNDETLLIEIQKVADIIYEDLNEHASYSFFTGNMGVAYSFLQVFIHTGEEKYLNHCFEISKKSKIHFSLIERPIIDLLNGVSGILLGLLHIYSRGYQEQWILDDINFYIDYIINKSYKSKNGNIYWDLTARINKGLTGFSHGASGIGFVFNELYKLTGNTAFKEIFESALRYEDEYYEPAIKNWLDFRKFPYKPEDSTQFDENARNGNLSFFLESKHMFAWCHGAPGIIGVRENVSSDIINEILLSIETSKNHSLCHSGTGNLLCLIENESINPKFYRKHLEDKCHALIAYHDKHKSFINGYNDSDSDEYGLFMGELGTFYFLLKAYKHLTDLATEDTINILYPKVSPKTFLEIYNQQIYNSIAEASFPKTFSLIHEKYPDLVLEKEDIQTENLRKKVAKLEDEIINDVFLFEQTIKQVELDIESHSYEFFKNKTDFNFFKSNIKNNNLSEIQVNIGNKVQFVQTRWDWNPMTNEKWSLNNKNNIGQYEYAITPDYENMFISLSKVQTYIIDYLKGNENTPLEDIINHFYEIIDGSPDNKKLIQENVISNVFYLLKNRALEIKYEKI
ncbi:lanthionine synthetase LanC family protein [Chryseobacterium artocarpi]|nr:lanthionine synthetase LanC family protein [Chryseobacterium artocarpi]